MGLNRDRQWRQAMQGGKLASVGRNDSNTSDEPTSVSLQGSEKNTSCHDYLLLTGTTPSVCPDGKQMHHANLWFG